MKVEKYLEKFGSRFSDKLVCVTGSTGGLGGCICDHLAILGARLVLADRNPQKQESLKKRLKEKYPSLEISCIRLDLDDLESVREAITALKEMKLDYFINNAGSYGIKRKKSYFGYNNVFTVNFISPYLVIRSLLQDEENIKAVCVASIAHKLSKADKRDIDRSKFKLDSRVYGNAKRFLMFSLWELKKSERLSICHPGITPTGITSNYPSFIKAVIKYPMKLLFQSPKKAALSVIEAMGGDPGEFCWIGPKVFGIWGSPKLKSLKKPSEDELNVVCSVADEIYKRFKEEKK